jgi:hypothetical protein
MVSGSCTLPPRWPPQRVVIESENISMISAECIILSYTFMNTSNNIDMVAMEIKQNIFNIITTQE